MPLQESPTSPTTKAGTSLAKQPPRAAVERGSASWLSLLMRPLVRPFDLARFVLKRQYHHPGLTLLALLGIVLAVGLVANATCFSDAASQLILNQRLAEFSRMTGRPAFSTAVYTFPSARKPITLEGAEQAADNVANTLASEVGLPLEHVGIQVSSGGLMLQPQAGSDLFGDGEAYLGSIDLAYIAGVEEHMEIVMGDPFDIAPSGDALDVWVHARLAEKMGIHIGEEFRIGITLISTAIPIRVRGVWQGRDPTDLFWFTDPDSAFKDTLLVRRQDYITFVEPIIPSKTGIVYWHVILDESKVTSDNASSYIAGFERGLNVVNKYLPDVRLDSPPLGPLKEFLEQERPLITLLLSFNVPAFGFLLYFLILTSAIIARWQQRDTAVLVSRGVTTRGILGLTLIEEMLLFVLGYPLGVGFGMALALLMGYVSSFLSFTPRPAMPVSLRGINVPLTLVALGVALATRLWAAAQAARHSVVDVEQEQGRPMRAPFWYRYYLDLLLLLPTAYAYHQLTNRGTLAMLVQDRPEDLYRDPLLILVPGLFILAASLLALRLFPLVMRLIDGLAGTLPWITPHLTLRQLSRHSSGYINPLLLIILSLALGVYMMSLAASLDQWLIDRMYYRVGGDLAFDPYLPRGETTGPEAAVATEMPVGGIWIPLPYQFLDLPGVVSATRVGDYFAEINLAAGNEINGRFLALDRLDFPSVAWFRPDFAQEPLGGLMNRLAVSPNAILVSQRFLDQYPVRIGDQIPTSVALGSGVRVSALFTVVGAYEYFPTAYEDEDGMTVIGNLEYLSDFIGVPPYHRIWLRAQEGAEGRVIFKSVKRLGIEAGRPGDAPALIAEEQAKVERVGVFGTLSVGFMAAVAMAGLGLLLYNYASLRERLFRLAVLRAIGLNLRQVVFQVVMEYALLTVCGAAIGAFIGVAASEFFAPFFTVTGETGVPLPPLISIIDRQDIVYMAVAFVAVMVLLGVAVIARTFSRRHFDILRAHWG